MLKSRRKTFYIERFGTFFTFFCCNWKFSVRLEYVDYKFLPLVCMQPHFLGSTIQAVYKSAN